MIKTGVKEARRRFSEYINMVQQGEEIVITKRDEPVAKLVPIERRATKALKSHKELRDLVREAGKPLSEVVIESRQERF